MSSLSDATTCHFAECNPGDLLATDTGTRYGYAITVGFTWWTASERLVLHPGATLAQAVTELFNALGDWTNYAVVARDPQPVVDTSLLLEPGTLATILCATSTNANSMTCAELVVALGQHSPLAIVQLKRLDINDVEGDGAKSTQGEAQNEAEGAAASSGGLNPLTKLEDWLKTLGIWTGVALVVVLVILAVIYLPHKDWE